MTQSIIMTAVESQSDADPTTRTTRQERRVIRRLIASLSEPDRIIFLHRLDGLTPTEISNQTGKDVGLIIKSLAKSYSTLRVMTPTSVDGYTTPLIAATK